MGRQEGPRSPKVIITLLLGYSQINGTEGLYLEYKKADGSNEKSRNGPLKCLYFKVLHHIVMGNGSVKPCIVA